MPSGKPTTRYPRNPRLMTAHQLAKPLVCRRPVQVVRTFNPQHIQYATRKHHLTVRAASVQPCRPERPTGRARSARLRDAVRKAQLHPTMGRQGRGDSEKCTLAGNSEFAVTCLPGWLRLSSTIFLLSLRYQRKNGILPYTLIADRGQAGAMPRRDTERRFRADVSHGAAATNERYRLCERTRRPGNFSHIE